MNQNSTQMVEVAEVQPQVAVVAAVVSITEKNYTQAQLDVYVNSQRTGKGVQGKVFGQKVSETNFTDADRKLIQDARFERRTELAHGSKKASELAFVRQKHITLVRRTESANGMRIGMGFVDTKIKAELDAAKKAAKPAKK